MHTLSGSDVPKPVEWGLLLSSAGLALGAFGLLLWSRSTWDAPALACVAVPVPSHVRVAVAVAQWIIRLLPFVVFLGAIPTLVFGATAAVAIAKGDSPRRMGRLVALVAVGIAFASLVLAGVVSYAGHAVHQLVNEAEGPCSASAEVAAQRGDEPVEARVLKMPDDASGIINVRLADDRCSASLLE